MSRILHVSMVVGMLSGAGGWYALCFGRVEGRTVLMQASKEGEEWLVNLLLALGADVDAVDRGPRTGGLTPLGFAARTGPTAIARRLLDAGADPNPPSLSPLCAATSSGTIEMMELLLSHGARVQDGGTASALRCLPESPERREKARLLLAHGADVNSADSLGSSVFITSVVSERLDVAGLLLEHGVDVNERTEDGRTALMEASRRGKVAAVEFLLARGADPTLKDSEGRTALAHAWQARDSRSQVVREGSGAVIEVLVSRPAARGTVTPTPAGH